MVRYYICETCKVKFPLGARGNSRSRHLNSLGHKHARLIRDLLRQPSLTYAEIGRRVGVTRQRIHIHAKQMYPHETGRRQRMVTRTMNRHLAAWWEEHNNHPSIVRLNELGFRVKPIPHFSKDGHVDKYYRERVDVNGAVVALRNLIRRQIGHRKYLQISAPGDPDIEFVIFNLRSELFYVFPASRLRKGARRTSFSDDPSSAGSYASQHDFRDYREAWTLPSRKKPIRKK